MDVFAFEDIHRLPSRNMRKNDAEAANRSSFAVKLIMKIREKPRASNHQ